jgi:hypothetical protein
MIGGVGVKKEISEMRFELLAALLIGASSAAVAQCASPSLQAQPTLVQFNTSGVLVFTPNTLNNSLAFTKLTKAGDAIWVAVTVPNNPSGPWSISVTDSQGNTFKKLNQVNDGLPGIQSVAHFVATNIWGDVTTPDTITVHWPSDNYKGVIIAEVAGASGASAVLEGNNARVMDGVVGPGIGDVRSYSWTGKPNTLILAVSMNTYGGCSDAGGTGQPGPGAGTGFTNQLKTWASSDCPSIPLATFETKISDATGNINGAFDSSSGTNYYATVAAGFN